MVIEGEVGSVKMSKQMFGGACVPLRNLGILVKNMGTSQAKHNMSMY